MRRVCSYSMHSDSYESIWFNVGMMMYAVELYSLFDLDLDSRAQEGKTAKTSVPIIS